jgi:hypothetical protein
MSWRSLSSLRAAFSLPPPPKRQHLTLARELNQSLLDDQRRSSQRMTNVIATDDPTSLHQDLGSREAALAVLVVDER